MTTSPSDQPATYHKASRASRLHASIASQGVHSLARPHTSVALAGCRLSTGPLNRAVPRSRAVSGMGFMSSAPSSASSVTSRSSVWAPWYPCRLTHQLQAMRPTSKACRLASQPRLHKMSPMAAMTVQTSFRAQQLMGPALQPVGAAVAGLHAEPLGAESDDRWLHGGHALSPLDLDNQGSGPTPALCWLAFVCSLHAPTRAGPAQRLMGRCSTLGRRRTAP